jgi:hypothetical protein
MLLIALFGATLIKAMDEVKQYAEHALPGTTPDSVANEIFGLGSSDLVVYMLLVFTAAMIAHELGTLCFIVAREGRIKTIRLKNTGKPPELTLDEGKQYHLL